MPIFCFVFGMKNVMIETEKDEDGYFTINMIIKLVY